MSRSSVRLLWRESHAASAISAGILASLPAAVAAVSVMTALDALAGRGVGATLVAIGGSVPAGLALHTLGSLLCGALFGLVVALTAHHIAPGAGAFWGALYGLLVWFVGFFLVLPWFVPALIGVPARVTVLWHLAWGSVVGMLFHTMRPRERLDHALSRPSPGTPTAPR